MSDRPAYFVEVDREGCLTCKHGTLWTVVGPDDVAIAQSYVEIDDAQDMADMLNRAYREGWTAYDRVDERDQAQQRETDARISEEVERQRGEAGR